MATPLYIYAHTHEHAKIYTRTHVLLPTYMCAHAYAMHHGHVNHARYDGTTTGHMYTLLYISTG